jgi:hypothetical protein
LVIVHNRNEMAFWSRPTGKSCILPISGADPGISRAQCMISDKERQGHETPKDQKSILNLNHDLFAE